MLEQLADGPQPERLGGVLGLRARKPQPLRQPRGARIADRRAVKLERLEPTGSCELGWLHEWK
jgi:hypothetical protein